MKKTHLLLLLLMFLVSVNSCKKDDSSDSGTVSKETISAKWNVTGTNTVYESFEFNKSGSYIIVKYASLSSSEKIVLFGTYQVSDKSIVLSNLGTMKVSSLDGSKMNFVLTLTSDPGNSVSIEATKAAEVANSSKTDLLCRTWKMVTYNGDSVAGTEMELTVLFSDAGTYFVSYVNPIDENQGGLAQWQWKDSSENAICYSWEGAPTCDGSNEVQIVELSDKIAKIQEDSDMYVLVPFGTKSAVNGSGKTLQGKNLMKGLFKK